MKKLIQGFYLLIAVSILSTGNVSATWTASPSYPKAFIENKAQFDGRNKIENSQILYAIDHGPFQVYFTKTGVTYRLDKKLKRAKWDKTIPLNNVHEWDSIMTMRKGVNMVSDIIHMQWVNSNPNVEVVALNQVSDYYSYAMGSNNINYNFIRGFEMLVYKNIYPGIDIEYEFHADGGFKYSYILHPGANPKLIQMKYSDDAKITKDANGNLKFATQFGDITEHAPFTFYGADKNREIKSSFNFQNQTIGFDLANYDNTKKVVIDPWTLFPSSPNSNKVWEVETDAAGNVYTYSGDMPITLRKYNGAGALQWTYLSPWDSAGYWIGGFKVHPSGDIYMTSGSNGEIRKINTAGSQQWFNNPNTLTSYEYWSLAFNCDLTRLVVGGTRLTFSIPFPVIRGTVMEVNLNSGALISTTVVGYGNVVGIPPNIQEVSSICSGPNNSYFYLTLDTVGSITDDLTTINFGEATSYGFDYYIPGYGFGTKQPISAIRATYTHFFTHNGIEIHKRDLNTGAIVATGSIPNGISTTTFFGTKIQGNGGLDIDSCGNVYVGSGSEVHKFDSNLNLVASASTPGPVYDVAVSNSGEIAASGNNFVASVALSSCNSPIDICVTTLIATATSTNILCAGECTGTASANPIGGTPPYTYLWSNGFTVPSISNLCAGTYTVIITDSDNLVDSATVTITAPIPITTAVTTVDASCGSLNGSATVSVSGGTAPFTFIWSPMGGNDSVATGLAAGIYDVTITDANGCSVTETIEIISADGPIVTIASQIDASCNGSADGSATISATMGTPPYTYSWNTVPVQTTSTATGLGAGIYTVTVTDSLGCIKNLTLLIEEPDEIVLTAAVVNDDPCGQSTGSVSATASGGAAGFTYSWNTTPVQTTPVATNLGAGTYTVTVTDANGCTATESVTITAPPALSSTTSSTTALCGQANGSASVSTSGGTTPYTYLWSPTGGTGALATGLNSGAYTCLITDANGCTQTVSVTVADSGFVIASAGTDVTIQVGESTTLTATGGTIYSWTPIEGLESPNSATTVANPVISTTYCVLVTDDFGCSDTACVRVTVEEACGEVYVPNAFSPDGANDPENEKQCVYGKCIQAMEFVIYTRWGEKVFETNDQKQCWDGTYKGKQMNTGVYVYYLKATLTDGNKISRKGDITLIR